MLRKSLSTILRSVPPPAQPSIADAKAASIIALSEKRKHLAHNHDHDHDHDHHHHGDHQQTTERKIISPADLAKRLRGEIDIANQPSEATPRPSSKQGGVAREIIDLYRGLLKATRTRPAVKSQDLSQEQRHRLVLNDSQRYVREQFRAGRAIPRRNFDKVQYQIHYARTKLAELQQGAANRTGVSFLSFGDYSHQQQPRKKKS
jgi:hypothetical protein